MITILHGDNESQIHTELVKQINAAKLRGVEVSRLDAKKIEIATLETAIGTDALFAQEKLVIIDGLFALPKSKRKDVLISWLQAHDVPEISVIITEKKILTATQLKSFPAVKSMVFKYPALLFQWLEVVGTVPSSRAIELFHQLLAREEAELVFIMLIRQVRTLIAFVCDGVFDGPPFLRGRVASQAKFFTKEKILALHSRLLSLDQELKTSRNSLTLTQNLDLILVEL